MVTASSTTKTKTELSIYFLIIILPFIMFYWMFPFLSAKTLGADYQLFSINEQLEFLFSIKTGSFPLYSPGYSFGHSSSALTLSQVYHPLSHISSILPGYWNGKALEWNTVFRLLSLGITQLALFLFLRTTKLNLLFAFLLSLITVYNMRMLEAFRYGASIEAFTGHLLLCSVIGWYFIRPMKWLGPLSITGMTYLLVCSGHPPMMFYGLLGAGVFTLIVPFFVTIMRPDIDVDFKTAFRFWVEAGLYILLGILLASAYIVPFYFEFVATNIGYAHSPGVIDVVDPETFIGALNNFFMPFVAAVLTGFGGSSLILIALLLPLIRFFKIKIPVCIWVIWGIMLIALLYSLGSQTPVYVLAREYLPFVSSAGGCGRIAMLMPILIMMMLAWIVKAGDFPARIKGHQELPYYTFLALAAFILIPLYLLPVYLFKPLVGYFTPHHFRKIPFWIEFISVLFGMMSLATLVLYGRYQKLTRVFGFLLCLTVLLQIGTIIKYGIWIEEKKDRPTFEQMLDQKKDKIDFGFHQNPAMHHAVMNNHIRRSSFVEPFLGKLYTQITPVSGPDEAYEKMEQKRIPQQVFVEGYDPEKAKLITEGGKKVKEGSLDLIYSSFNRLEFRAVSQAPVLFGLSYPFTGHWSAWVNDKKVSVYRANGAAHAIEIPAGESIIEFRYYSKAYFWGILISCMTFAFIGLFVCFYALKGFPRIAGMVFILIIGVGGFLLWNNSLYNGDNLETEYSWSYTAPKSPPNLAYGKKTSGVSLKQLQSSFWGFHNSNAVDGETEPGSGFTIKPIQDRSLIIDLYKIREIKTILIYGRIKQAFVSLSQEGSQWHDIEYNIIEGSQSYPLRIDFKETKSARFLRIISYNSEVEIDEVEIY